jgi:Na(+)-translocating NADH:ubiquinone oxidoreductase A subunit
MLMGEWRAIFPLSFFGAGTTVNFRGGYNLLLDGRPDNRLEEVSLPEVLYLPLKGDRFSFTRILVADGQKMRAGEPVAEDPDHFGAPLLSPCSGTADPTSVEGHIVLRDLSRDPLISTKQVDKERNSAAGTDPGKSLLRLGAWEYLYDAWTGRAPDPASIPQAVIVSTVRYEPFLARGDVLLRDRLEEFIAGIRSLQSLYGSTKVYVVLPKLKAGLTRQIKQLCRDLDRVSVVEIPIRYPYDQFRLLAQRMGLKPTKGVIWAFRVEGVLAVGGAMNSGRPCIERVVSISGSGASRPIHLKLTAGYPIEQLMKEYRQEDCIAIEGGLFTGRILPAELKGLRPECGGITMIRRHTKYSVSERIQSVFDRRSYFPCFVSSLCRPFPDQPTNAVGGYSRPCVSCGFCREVCPAGIVPYHLNRLLERGRVEDAKAHRVDLCVGCGLCSFVCPSKIELSARFRQAHQQILPSASLGARGAV